MVVAGCKIYNDKVEGISWLGARSGRPALAFYQQGSDTHLAGNRCVVWGCFLQRAFLLDQRIDWLQCLRRNQDSINPLRVL